jgi:hypothetical protein
MGMWARSKCSYVKSEPSIVPYLIPFQQESKADLTSYLTLIYSGNWERKTSATISDFAKEIRETASGTRSETVGGESTENVSGSKTTTAAAYHLTAPTIVIGAPKGGPSLMPLITNALNDIKSALDIIADHVHPSEGSISPDSSAIHNKANGVGSTNTSLQTLQE